MIKRKNKKIIGAMALTLGIMSVTGYQLIPKINAGTNNNVPEINAYQKDGHTKIELGINMADEDVLKTISFDDGAMTDSNLTWNGVGTQSISSDTAATGTKALKITDTINTWAGNWYSYPGTKSQTNYFTTGPTRIPNKSWLSVSFKAKTNGDNTNISARSRGEWLDRAFPMVDASGRQIKFAQNVDFNGDYKSFKVYVDGGTVNLPDGGIYVLSGGKQTDYCFGIAYFVYNASSQTFTLDTRSNSALWNTARPMLVPSYIGKSVFNVGENVLQLQQECVCFESRKVPNNNEWTSFSMNQYFDNKYYDYDYAGLLPAFGTSTNGTTYIDDIRFGYASLSNIYRDGVAVHSGYESDFEDTGAIDRAKPNKPSNITATKSGNTVNLAWSGANDNGTTYNYTADSTSYKTQTKSAMSAPKPVTVTSGIKGYAVVVDNNPSTVIPATNGTTPYTSISTNLTEGYHYAHIASIDNAGNVSDTQTLNYDLIAPKLTLTPNVISGVSNKDLTVDVKAVDTESGVKSITLPDGTVVNGDSATFIVTKNGVYTVKCIDNAGNESSQPIAIGGTGASVSIDKTAPTINYSYDKPTGWTNQNVVATIKVTDSESGVDRIELPDGTTVNGDTATLTVKSNGTYRVTAYDKAGNSSYKDISIDGSDIGIDRLAPDLDVTADKTTWTNQPITLTANADDFDSGIKYIELPDKTQISGVLATYKINANGTYTFKAMDNAGNITTNDVEVKTIDTTKPTMNLTIDDNATWTANDVTINAEAADTESGVKTITLPDGTKVNSDKTSFKADGNGIYKFQVEDNAGNVTEQSIEVKCIDKKTPNAPDISGIASDGLDKWRNTDYIPSVKLSSDAVASGVKEIQYQIIDKNTNNVIKDWGTFVPGKTVISNEGISAVNFRTVSNSGVSSDSVGITVKIDKTKPTATATANNTDWTNQGIGINIISKDSLSGIASVKLPDGKITTLENATYLAMNNGTYDFVVTDNAGNTQTVSATVTKIDTAKPNSIKINNLPGTNWMNTNYSPSIDVSSDGIASGVKEIDYQLIDQSTGKVINDWAKYIKGQTAISNEGITKMNIKAISNSGAESDISTLTVKIDKTKPELTATNATSNNSLKAGLDYKIESSDALSGLVSVALPDGRELTTFPANITIDKVGDYKVTAKDNAGNVQECTINISDKLNGNRTTVLNEINTGIEKWIPNNNSVSDDLKKIVEDSVGSGYNVTITDWKLQPSTENDLGNVVCTVTVDDGNGNNLIVPVNKPIAKIEQTVQSARDKFLAHIGDLTATNNTTKEDVIGQIRQYITNPNILVDIDNFDKKNATMQADGVITGVAVFKDKDGNSCTADLNIKISKLAETLEDAESLIKANIGKIKVDNNTTEQTIIDQVKPYLYTDELTPSIKDFKINKSTEKTTGEVTCIIIITNKEGKSVSIPFDGIIDKLSQSIDTVLDDINLHIGELVVNNETTENDVLLQLNKYVTNSNLKLSIADFAKAKADYIATGKIDFKLTASDITTNKNKTGNMELPIAKLINTEKPVVTLVDNSPKESPTINEVVPEIISDVSTGDFQQVKEDIQTLPKTVSYPIVGGIGLILVLSTFGLVYLVSRKNSRKVS